MIPLQYIQTDTHTGMLLEYVSELERVANSFPDASTNRFMLLAEYRNLINKICAGSSRDPEHEGMVGILCVLLDGIDVLLQDVTAFSAFHQVFLAKIPEYINEHLNFPDSKMPCSFLVRHMSSHLWVRPLSLDEQQYYIDRITHKYDGKDAEVDVLAPEVLIEDVSLVIDDATPDEISIDDFFTVETASSDLEPEIVILHQPADFDKQAASDASAESLRDIASIYEASTATGDASIHVGDKTRELIDLISSELREIIEFYRFNAIPDEQDISTVVKEAAVLTGNIGNAVNLVGLEALSALCDGLSAVLARPDFVANKSAEDVVDNLAQWPQLMLNYLESGFNEQSSRKLVQYLVEHQLIVELDAAGLNAIINNLINPVFPDEDKVVRYDSAMADDVDLTLPDDVNPELLESLLQDLPKQTEELTTALFAIRDAKDIAAIEIAQRVAHTLKGSANVVGVKGIANISHHMEDILEILTKSRQLPSAQLLDVLMASSDCIASMADALMGYDAPPDNALETLQTVLSWSNKINELGISVATDSESDPSLPLATNPDGLVQAEKQQVASPVENSLRIPVHLADNLLRLAGENLITTGQIQESIKNSINKQSLLKNHNKLLQQLAFDLEHLIDIQGITSNFSRSVANDTFDSLELDEYHELHTVSRRLIEIAADSLALTSDLNSDLTDLHNLVISHAVIQRENQELVLRTRMVPVKSIVPRLKRGIRQVTRLTGKEVDLEILDNDVYLDSEILNELIEPLMHLLRNAADHGIESADIRKQQHKPVKGKIGITFERVGDSVQILVAEDGQGLDVDKIYAKAISRNLINEAEELTVEETYRLILLHGFSTRDEATQVSGRGVGLDAVSVKIRELKGTIEINSLKGDGCSFKLTLPVSSFSTHSLLVHVRENVYAISTRGVDEILFPGTGEIVDTADGMSFEWDGQSYKAIIIDDLFNLGPDRRTIDRSHRPILLVRDELGVKTAILVQNIKDSRHVVVKPLGKYLPKLSGVVGSTILGDGSVASVIDLPELLQNLGNQKYVIAFNQDRAQNPIRALPCILVVDDSLSARRSLMQFVQDLGYEVREARDGIEAVSMIDLRRPDLVLADMEMPRMNGLELTSHIRTNYDAKSLPVIMITSRSSDKHRQAAQERGVNHFLVKPFAEDLLAEQINLMLGSG
jgi:chemotaxis protein histidine kinase CheA